MYRKEGWLMDKIERDKLITQVYNKLEEYDQDSITLSFLYSIALGNFLDLYVTEVLLGNITPKNPR